MVNNIVYFCERCKDHHEINKINKKCLVYSKIVTKPDQKLKICFDISNDICFDPSTGSCFDPSTGSCFDPSTGSCIDKYYDDYSIVDEDDCSILKDSNTSPS